MYIFKEWVDRSAPGEFDIQIHHSGTLVRQGTEIVAMQRNTIEMTIISWWDVADRIPEYNLLTVGYLFKDWNPVKAVMDGDIGKEYKARIAKDLGIQILDYYYAGPRIVNLREVRNVKTPADLAGVKLRMPGSNCGGQLKIIAAMLTRTGRSTFRPSSPIEHPLEQPGPADARWPGVCAAWLLGGGPRCAGLMALPCGHHQCPRLGFGRQHPVEADQVQPRSWYGRKKGALRSPVQPGAA